MGEVIAHPALQRAATLSTAEEREELLFSFAAVQLGLERERNLTVEAQVALRRCVVEAGLTQTELAEYLREHRSDVIAFLSGAGL